MKSRVKKAVIPAAGLGTRFLPATKAQPKEMLPIIDKPIIQYVVEEAVAAGIEEIILVTGANKRAIEDHFDFCSELESFLQKNGKTKYLKIVRQIASLADFTYVRQKGPYGNGTPVLCVKHLIGDEPFAVIWGDEPFIGHPPRLKQLIDVYEKYKNPVLTAYEVDDAGTEKHGILAADLVQKNVYRVKKIIEKPGPELAPSRLATLGGYILTPDIFPALEKTPLGKNNELWLVDAIFRLSKKRPIYACKVTGKYYDVGSKLGWLKANLEIGLIHPEIGKEVKKYLKERE